MDTNNFEPEKVYRYDWDDKGIYSKDAAWDIMADEALVSVVQLVDASDYDKLLALYKAQRIAVLEEAARHIEQGSSYSGWAESGHTHAKWIRSLGSKDPISEKYGEIEIK